MNITEITNKMRFIERDIPCIDPGFYGKDQPKMKILQQFHRDLTNGGGEWVDVPTER